MKRFLPLAILAITSLCCVPLALSQKVLGTINVGGQPGLLAINSATNMIYVANATLKTVTVIDGSSDQVVTNVPMPSQPFAVAVNSVTDRIYVTTGSPSNAVVVIDGSSNTVLTTVSASSPGTIAVNSVTNLVYFSDKATSLDVLDGSTDQIVDTITTTYGIQGIAVNQITNRIYLSESSFPDSQIVIVDGGTNQAFTFQISGACLLTSIAVDSALNRVYVVDNNCSRLYVISGQSNKLLATILQGTGSLMTVNASLNTIADFGGVTSPVLSFVNLQTDKTVATLAFPRGGSGPAAVAANGNRYYIPFSHSGEIAVVSGPKSFPNRAAGNKR
jgi:YVTN family beta-propeller protein